MREYTVQWRAAVAVTIALLGLAVPGDSAAQVPCVAGMAGEHACRDVDLLAHLSIASLGGEAGVQLNDLWGWTDPETGHRYALVGRSDGTAFVDVTDPVHPVYLGDLPRSGSRSTIWRDVKTLNRYAYVVADAAGQHGLQVFDLHSLRGTASPRTFQAAGGYYGFGSAHNVFVHAETGYAYVVGASGSGIEPGNPCGGGLLMLDLSDPVAPGFAGCFNHAGTGRAGTGYTHDVQCVVYRGPDPEYADREICFGFNETAVSVADVTDKSNPEAVGLGEYPSVRYTHQGWLSDDHRWLFVGDELDELGGVGTIRTLVFDVTDLDDPVLATEYLSERPGIDHNMYVFGSTLVQANYRDGVVVLDVEDPRSPEEIARFDTTPVDPSGTWRGAWSVYPFFGDGLVLASSIDEGLFVLDVTSDRYPRSAEPPVEVPDRLVVDPAWPNPFATSTRIELRTPEDGVLRAELVDALGRVLRVLHDGPVTAGHVVSVVVDGADLAPGSYYVRVDGPGGTRTMSVTRIR